MKLTQHDNIHMGLGRTDNKGMTAYELKGIRQTLGVTRAGLGELLGCDISVIRVYENETGDDGTKISNKHAKHLRLIAQMPIKKRKQFIKISGCRIPQDTQF